jgi:cell division protein ZapA
MTSIKTKNIITVKIVERDYPFVINREEDEEHIRGAGKLVEDFLLLYRQRFSDQAVQDSLAMAALKFAVKSFQLELETKRNEQT